MVQVNLTDGITLMSGSIFCYTDPSKGDVALHDIVQPLSNICRFAGQLPYFYSVAQHCVNVSHIVPEPFAFTALMHDTAEAFTNDIVTPLKVAVPLFKELELLIESDMARRFGFHYPLPPEVRLADSQMLALEMKHIRGQNPADHSHLNGVDYDHLFDMPGVDLQTQPPRLAFANFMRRFEELRP